MSAEGDGRHGEHASVLMLMPAAVLILVVLSSVAVDAAIAFMGRRELGAAAAAAANNAVVAALSEEGFYTRCGALDLESTVVEEVVETTFARHGSEAYTLVAVDSETGTSEGGGDPLVRVEAEARVSLLFSPVILGGGEQTVRASSEAIAAPVVAASGSCE